MADKVDLAKGADSFRLCNPPPFLAALNYASLEVGCLLSACCLTESDTQAIP